MEYVGKLGSFITSVHNFYNEINPATLSGAIDIVVVEQQDGDLACSPFHVRFGKLSVMMPQEKKVQIKVNGDVVPYVMKVGEAGEAFFVFETEHEVPEEFQTSPIMEAVPEKNEEEPPYLDIGESKDALKTEKSSNEDHFEEEEERTTIPAELQSPKMIIEEQMDKVVTKIHKEEEPEVTPKNDVYLMKDGSTLLERVIPEAITTTTVAKERFIVRPAEGDIYSTFMDVIHTSVHKRDDNEKSDNGGRGDESIVLDIAGYKTGEDSEPKSENSRELQEEIAIQELSRLNLLDHGHEEKGVTREVTPREVTFLNEEKKEEPEQVKINEPDEKNDLEMMPGQTYRVELSLCGFSSFSTNEEENKAAFDAEKITYDNFTHNPNLLNDKRLVFRYNERYYSAGKTGPLFASLSLYKEETNEEEEKKQISDSRESYQFGKGWRQWLSRSSVDAASEEKTKKEENPKNEDEEQQTTTTFTTTTTTTSVGWKADHTHPEEQSQEELVQFTQKKVYAKTLRLTSDQLKSLGLKSGANTISFSVSSAYQGTATCAAKIFYWKHNYNIVISDIDGTITKSDALGHVFTMIGKDWTHNGIAKLYTDISNNGYHFLYLTSRAIGQADYTRDYLKKVVQEKYQLPDGPVIMSPDRLFTSFHREVIMRKPEVFKMACLKDIQRLFGGRDPFYAGFGNRITDARSYRSVSVPSSKIFTIDPYGDLKLELLCGFKSSYIHLNDLVDQMFPPVIANETNNIVLNEYNDLNFWKSPLPSNFEIPELDAPVITSPKPKPIKPDPSALPPSNTLSSSTSTSGRGLLRSFTSSSSTSSSKNTSSKMLYSSNSAPNLNNVKKSPQASSLDADANISPALLPSAGASAATSPIAVPIDKKSNTHDSTHNTPTSPSIMNKMLSSVSRTFLSSSDSLEKPKPTDSQPSTQSENKPNPENEETTEVDELLDDLDMDEIPFI
ncbi:Lipin/Ned1/Smp2-domain-containing protein [Sporodiniella umbellata]|nr:Lipin/Ned1/Smp2-domain-containing protein [Sporodiniella umbellata]